MKFRGEMELHSARAVAASVRQLGMARGCSPSARRNPFLIFGFGSESLLPQPSARRHDDAATRQVSS